MLTQQYSIRTLIPTILLKFSYFVDLDFSYSKTRQAMRKPLAKIAFALSLSGPAYGAKTANYVC